ncbi:MAG: SDR family oxidoreductase [Elusimicrobiota bacterium]
MNNKSPAAFDRLFGFSGKTVVLTGANGILGAQYLESYLEAGLRVAAFDREVGRIIGLERRHKGRLLVRAVDLGEPAAVAAAFAAAVGAFKRIDGVHHNCAGKPAGFFDATEAYSLDAWRGVFRANVETSLLLTQRAIPYFKKRRAGALLFTSSIYGVVGADQRIYEGSSYEGRPINTPAAYSASKAAVLGLVRHLAAELGAWNIRVNALTPGGVSSGQNGVFQKRYSSRVPMGRMARGRDMVGPALFLLSDAASYVTGHNLVVDGGLTAW